MDYPRTVLLLWLFLMHSTLSHSQELSQYDRFQLYGGELYWQYLYECQGNTDSVRQAVEHMLTSRSFTYNVVRSKLEYSGNLNHYRVNPKRYGRTYLNTPKMYWDGEWSGKFVVEIGDGYYSVTVYDLQHKTKTQSVGHYKPEKIRAGKYVDDVTIHNRQGLLKSEFSNLSLMSLSLKDNFDFQAMNLQDTQK
jgi:hypothetical protein